LSTITDRRYSKIVTFAEQVARGPNEPPTSVEIFSKGARWYCRVRRGDEKTRPMGPYDKLQAERVQEARRILIAKNGTSRIMFE
jgi:hypothetical protein